MSITRILADAVISSGRNIKFYAADGSIKSESKKVVRIFDNQEELDADAQAEYDAMMAAGPDADVSAENTESEQEGTDDAQAAAPARSTKRGKGKGKEQMATKKASKKAAKKAVKKVSDGATVRVVAGREHDISNYVQSKSASGHTSYDNGDATAEKLRGKTLDEVYATAAKTLKEDEKALRKQYGHLNFGMQRMSLGNRLRKVAREKAAA